MHQVIALQRFEERHRLPRCLARCLTFQWQYHDSASHQTSPMMMHSWSLHKCILMLHLWKSLKIFNLQARKAWRGSRSANPSLAGSFCILLSLQAPYLSHIRREKSHHPHGTAAIQKVTSGSGKSHQGRRITMAQPVSSILGDVVKSSRSIAHSDDFEGHKLIQTNSRQLILLDLNILYWCPASRDQIKPLLVQPQISCNASGLAVANPIGRAMI